MLQDGAGLVLLDPLWHHVQNVVHHSCTQLQVKVALNSLLCDRLGHALGVSALELSREEVTQPSLQQGDNASHEEHPHSPPWCPDTNTRTLAHRTLVGGREECKYRGKMEEVWRERRRKGGGKEGRRGRVEGRRKEEEGRRKGGGKGGGREEGREEEGGGNVKRKGGGKVRKLISYYLYIPSHSLLHPLTPLLC